MTNRKGFIKHASFFMLAGLMAGKAVSIHAASPAVKGCVDYLLGASFVK